MTPYKNGTIVTITQTDQITPTPAPAINTHGVVMNWTYNDNTIMLGVDVAGKIYWVPQSDVGVV